MKKPCVFALNYLFILVVGQCNLMRAQPLEQRKCTCDENFSLLNNVADSEEHHEVSSMDQRDVCDFKCVDFCAEQIRQTLGGDPKIFTPEATENVCNRVHPERAVFKDGIVTYGTYSLEGCLSDQRVNVDKNLCCRFCQCQLVVKDLRRNVQKQHTLRAGGGEFVFSSLLDLSSQMSGQRTPRAYRCSEHNGQADCEQECRTAMAEALETYEVLQNSNDRDAFDALGDGGEERAATNRICELYGEPVHSPGFEAIVRIETGPRDSAHHKDISLGGLCCARRCECQLVFKRRHRNYTSIEHTLDIAHQLPVRTLSYYCDQEVRECVDDCKVAAGRELRNGPIQIATLSALDLEIFADFVTARRACVIYGRDATQEQRGIEIYLDYSTGDDAQKKLYPYSQQMLLGRLCCITHQFIPLFPLNKCVDWHHDEIPSGHIDSF